MSEEQEVNPQNEQEEREPSIYELLGIDDPDAEEPYAEEEEEAEAEAEREDKLAKKLAGRVDNLEKKFKQNVLKERTKDFMEGADDLEKDLFKAIAGDVKDPETLDRAIGLVKHRADKMREEIAKYEEQMLATAEQNAKGAWGASPVTRQPAQKQDDRVKDLKERIEQGDTKAGLELLMDGDSFLGGQF